MHSFLIFLIQTYIFVRHKVNVDLIIFNIIMQRIMNTEYILAVRKRRDFVCMFLGTVNPITIR